MSIRNRIKEHRRVRAGDLVPHERNWRNHPDSQREALQALYDEVGFARSLLAYELPDGSIIYADKAYNDYEIEDFLKEVDHIKLIPIRKKNSKRALPPEVSFVQHYYRKMIETAGSLIEQLLPKSIHAVTSQGFELKMALFVIASSLNCYLNL